MTETTTTTTTYFYLIPIIYVLTITAISQYFALRIKKQKEEEKNKKDDSTSLEIKRNTLKSKISEMQIEANRINTPENLVKHSVLTRKITKLKREFLKLEEEIKKEEKLEGENGSNQERINGSLEDLKKSGSNNKLLVALVFSWLLSYFKVIYDFQADSLYPIEYVLGEKMPDGRWRFCTTFFFAFLVVRFSTRMDRLFGLV